MPTSVGPNTFGEENLVFGYDLGDRNSFPGIPAVNCARVPTTSGQGNGTGNWSVTEITDGSITPPRKGARVFKFVAGTTSNLYRQANYYAGGGFSANNPLNPLILGRTSPSNFTTVSEANKYRWGFWVRGVETNNAGWGFTIDIGDRGGASYTVGNKTDWYFISCDNANGTNYNAYPYDFFDIFTSNQGLILYIADMGIMRAPGTVDNLPILQAYPQWVDYGQERSYTAGLIDLKGNSTIDLTNVSFDSNAQMEFDGTNDYVEIPNTSLPAPGSNHTLECVFQRNSGRTIINYGPASNGAAKYYNLEVPGSVLVSNLVTSAGSSQLVTSITISSNIWYHGVLSYNGSTMSLYVNGVLATSTTTSGDILNTSTPSLNIGRKNSGNGEYINGKVGLTKIYNRALTAQEIKANYNAVKGRFNI